MPVQPLGSGRVDFPQQGNRTDQTVFEVQRALNRLAGRNVVPETGNFDRTTVDAVRSFQQAHSASGLQATGDIDSRTIDVMNRELGRRSGPATRPAAGPLAPSELEAKSLEGSIHEAATRARLWAHQGARPQPHFQSGHSPPGGDIRMARLQRDSQTAGLRAELSINTNEAWSALRGCGRNPLQDPSAVIADQAATRTAERHLNRIAQALTRDFGPEAYQAMPHDDRVRLWVTALLAEPTAGQRILGQLTTPESHEQAIGDLNTARDTLLSANLDSQSAAHIRELFERVCSAG